jgi:type VI protein secretion system component VasK
MVYLIELSDVVVVYEQCVGCFLRPEELAPIMREPTFLVALAIAGITLIVVVKTIAGAIAGRRANRSELGDVREQLDQFAADLEDAQSNAANQAAQLADLQNRVDFTERLLAQTRDRSALGAAEKDK